MREGARTANGVDRVQAGSRFRTRAKAVCVGFLCIRAFLLSGMLMSGQGRGNFAVVARQKSVFPGALIGPKSLFCFTLIACNFEMYAARCCNRASAEDTPRAQQHTSLLIPCAHGKLNVKH